MTDDETPAARAARLEARRDAALLDGARLMWRNELAEAALHLLETEGVVTRDTLRRRLAARRDCEGLDRLVRAACEGALNALDGRPPRG